MIEQLPNDLIVKVLDFMDLPSKIRLAGFNSTLRRRIYHDCSQTWETIDFSRAYRAQQLITDAHLSQLLLNVNATSNTKNLNLMGCRNIGGVGLTPLRESRVLETVNLQQTQADTINQFPALWILDSCTQHKLYQVKLGENTIANGGNVLKSFFRRLRKANLQRAKAEGTQCSCCQQVVMNESRQLVASIHGLPDIYCDFCCKIFCRRGSCPMDVRECRECGDTSCRSCAVCMQCRFCGRTQCAVCDGEILCCSICEKYTCGECLRGLLFVEHEFCSCCGNANICPDCLEARPQVCVNNCVLCKDCQTVTTCETCDGCASKLCRDCSAAMEQCDRCRKSYCSETCSDRTAFCPACENRFCKECVEFEHCSGCNKTFCKSHDRLVDCSTCQSRHCRAVHVKRCKMCLKACFEACACGYRPTKRMRVI